MNTTTKKCPMCAEEIPLAATTCEYCGSQFLVTSRGYCQACHALREADETGRCRVCGSQVVDWHIESSLKVKPAPLTDTAMSQPVAPSVSSVTPSASEATELIVLPIKGEGVGIRFGSLYLDVILISLLFWAGTLFFYLINLGMGNLDQFDMDDYFTIFKDGTPILMLPLIWFFYFFIFEAVFGATPGKATSSLRVIQKTGGRISWSQAAIRALLSLFEDNPIGATVIRLTPQKQRIGDLLASTLVVNKEKIHKAEFRPPAITFEFHDYRRVAFAEITQGIVYKFGMIRNLVLRGLSLNGNPTKLTVQGLFFRPEFDMLRLNIERQYGLYFPEQIILWRLMMVILVPILFIAGMLFSFTQIDQWEPSKILPAAFFTNTPRTSSTSKIRSTSTPQIVSTDEPTDRSQPSATRKPNRTATRKPNPTATPQPVEVTFDTIGNYPQGQRIILVGRLALFSSTRCGEACGLLLENPANAAQKITIFVTVGSEPNQMKPLPTSYTKSDIQVRLDDGTFAVIGYRIRVTGSMCLTTSDEPCILDITKIELFQVK